MSNMKKFIDHLSGKTTTYEGGVGYAMSFKESIAEFFSLGLLNGKFYQSQEEVLEDAGSMFERALLECPEFATKAAIYGSTVNSLKLVPTIWLVYLSKLDDKTMFKAAFKKIIRNINLLHDFMEICRKASIREGLGRGVKKAVNERLFDLLNDYSVSRNKGTIAEIAKVTRPKFEDEKFQNYMKYISKGEITFERAKVLKNILDKIENNNITEDVLVNIKKYKLQLEEIKHAFKNFTKEDKEKLEDLSDQMKHAKNIEDIEEIHKEIVKLKEKELKSLSKEEKRLIYGALYEGLRYAALMMNLVALERAFATKTDIINKHSVRGNFKQELVLETDIPDELKEIVSNKINSIEDYRKSNILPFTLLNAEKMILTKEFKNAIHSMLETSSGEVFNLDKNTDILVGVDTSGSMTVNVSDSLSAIDIASFFGALIKSSHSISKVCAVADRCEEVKFYKNNIFSMAESIVQTNVGYGTYFESLMEKYTNQKYIILITDSMGADNLEKKWLNAKKLKGAKLIVWQLAVYKTKLSNNPSVIYLSGYSDRLLSLVKNIIENKGNQMEEIEKINIFS